MNEKCAVERQTECTKSTEDLSGVINNTDDLIKQLEKKLITVLRLSGPPVENEAFQDEKTLVPLAFELRHQSERLMNINNDIQDILDRLEN